ncbi:MAG TPA: cyanophycinase [Nocardioidaceae bacterium]|nr:cyanophycinase [Nocardioidaceae bacterium]
MPNATNVDEVGRDALGTSDGAGSPGPLLAIGGAEDKLGKRTILKTFLALAGGPDARIAVVPTASSLGPEVIEVYDALFRRLGAKDVIAARPESREEANSPEMVARLDGVTGIFMTGGNQLKLSAVVNGTAFGDAIRDAHERGVVIAGTSAGASIQSSHMVAFGSGGGTPKQRMTQLAAGLGLMQDCVIDQHFNQRNRYGRLLMLVAQNPSLLGVGVDEDTAAIVTVEDGEQILRVAGRGAVSIFDGTNVVSNAHEARKTAPLLASGVILHVLPDDAVFNLTRRALVPQRAAVDPDEAEELAVAGRDLRKLARDIAAGDVSPSELRRRRSRRPETHPAPVPTSAPAPAPTPEGDTA